MENSLLAIAMATGEYLLLSRQSWGRCTLGPSAEARSSASSSVEGREPLSKCKSLGKNAVYSWYMNPEVPFLLSSRGWVPRV